MFTSVIIWSCQTELISDGQVALLVEHQIRDSGIPDSNLDLVCCIFSLPITKHKG